MNNQITIDPNLLLKVNQLVSLYQMFLKEKKINVEQTKKLLFGFLSPKASKTIMSLLDVAARNPNMVRKINQIKKMTEVLLFIELGEVYEAFMPQNIINKLKSMRPLCALANKITKQLNKLLKSLPNTVKKNLKYINYPEQINKVICSGKKSASVERINMLREFYLKNKESISNMPSVSYVLGKVNELNKQINKKISKRPSMKKKPSMKQKRRSSMKKKPSRRSSRKPSMKPKRRSTMKRRTSRK